MLSQMPTQEKGNVIPQILKLPRGRSIPSLLLTFTPEKEMGYYLPSGGAEN
jgi:hypothetical protein